MNRINIAFTILFSSITCALFAQSPEDVESYIDHYKKIAIEEQVTFGIPAAITLAQGIHESACGMSELATQANNHFGIKCKNTWKGETFLHDDDAPKECFRKYPSAEHSFRDHSSFLKENNRYHFLFDIEVTDYKAWASGLKRAGYATNPQYVSRLTDLIEKYNLQQYTYEGLNKTFETPKEMVPTVDAKPITEVKTAPTPPPASTAPIIPSPEPTVKSNTTTQYYKGLQGFWAKKGEVLTQHALDLNIRYPRLLMLNDLADAPLEHDQFIFIERKRKVGTNEYHIVKEGEDMLYIAQVEALMIEFLYRYNHMKPGQEPLAGERLNLQYTAYETPKLKNAEVVSAPMVTPTTIPVVKKEQEPVPVVKEVPRVEEVKEVPKAEEEKKETPVTVKKIEEEETKPIEIVIVEEKKEEPKQEEVSVVVTTTTKVTNHGGDPRNTNPIIDPEKARRIENLLATDNKREVDSLAEAQRLEKEERERKEREMMERIRKNDEYVKNVTAKIDEDRRQVEARQDEEIKKRRAIEEEERKRIEAEQVERDRLEAMQASANLAKTQQEEKDRLQAEEAARNLAAQEEAKRLAAEKAERQRKDEEAARQLKYNEPGISDSVKNLKRTYDNIIYRTLPERKPLVQQKPVKDTLAVKPSKWVKPNTTVMNTNQGKKEETAKNKVEKTATGIKRDVNDKSSNSKKDDKTVSAQKNGKTKSVKEEDAKNAKNKKGDTKGDKKDDKNKLSDKNKKDKKDDVKKGKEDPKKKNDKNSKTDPKKKAKK